MAAVTTGVIGAGTALYSGKKRADAAKDAARTQAISADAAAAEAARQYDLTREDIAPYREAGGLALQEQQALLGLQGPQEQAAAYSRFTESPGQQFLRDQGLRMVNSSSAVSGAGGGERLRALTRFGQGLAAQNFGDYFNRLGGLSGTGYQATTTGSALGAQSVAAQNAARMQSAQARASGILGAQSARDQALSGGLQALPYIMEGFGDSTPEAAFGASGWEGTGGI